MEKDSDGSFLGKELRRLRLKAGLSQEDLAAKMGYERTVITKAETGYRPPSPDVAEATPGSSPSSTRWSKTA